MEKGNENIIILHGWGLSGDKYNKLKSKLKSLGYSVFAPDLPGFGSEPLINSSMDLDDYVDFLQNYIKNKIFSSKINKRKRIVLIGHSFGGRVAIKYAWRYPDEISAIILSGTPLIRDNSIIKKIAHIISIAGRMILKHFSARIRNKFRKALYFMIGEWDYYKAGALREVFKNIVGEQVILYLQKINVPVLLLWGQEDRLVPAINIEKVQRFSPNIKTKIIEGIGHKFPYENPELFAKETVSFLHYCQSKHV